MKVKNQRLYTFLQRFKPFKGRVRIQNAGMPFRYRVVQQGDERDIQRLESGEEYAVCCPYCGDKRFRLNISYMFGESIERVDMWHLVHCWNENCEVQSMLRKNYEAFCDELDEGELPPVEMDCESVSGPFSMDEIAAECRRDLMVVDGVTRVDTLDAGHPAVRYLLGRRFDLRILGLGYGVGFCFNRDQHDRGARFAHKRLIIPIFYKGVYVGWQARAIEGLTKLHLNQGCADKEWPYTEPKYWTSTGTRKSFFLYSYDLAARQNTVVIVEGPTDAWRVGQCGVAALGRRVSMYQRKLVAETWAERPGKIVLIGDPGFEADWRMNYETLNKEIGEPGKVVLILPEDKDPGAMTREELWEMIHDHCKV